MLSSPSIPCDGGMEECTMMQEEEWEVLKVRSEIKYGMQS
jgi:hypothetical protein